MVDLVVPHVLRKVEELRALWSLLVRLIDICVLSTRELFLLHECIVQELSATIPVWKTSSISRLARIDDEIRNVVQFSNNHNKVRPNY